MEKGTCFATLAVGPEFRMLAALLALDLHELAPEIPLLVLSDCPADFASHPNVISIPHRNRGVWYCYHDKRFVLAEALSRFSACVFIDADCRIRRRPPPTIQRLPPGLHAISHKSLLDKVTFESRAERSGGGKWSLNTAARRSDLMCSAAQALGLELKHARFIPEACFSVVADGEREWAFLETWDWLARRFQARGFSWGEGRSIGLAALRVGWEPQLLQDARDWLFKDLFFNDDSSSPSDVRYLRERAIVAVAHRRLSRPHWLGTLRRAVTSIVNLVRILVGGGRIVRRSGPSMEASRV